jgi:hypothetical protein
MLRRSGVGTFLPFYYLFCPDHLALSFSVRNTAPTDLCLFRLWKNRPLWLRPFARPPGAAVRHPRQRGRARRREDAALARPPGEDAHAGRVQGCVGDA